MLTRLWYTSFHKVWVNELDSYNGAPLAITVKPIRLSVDPTFTHVTIGTLEIPVSNEIINTQSMVVTFL